MKARFVRDSLNEAYGQKDKVRMEDIKTKAAGDEEKEIALATTQAKLISKGEKAAARAEAAVDVFGFDHPVTKVFQGRARELGASRGAASKGVLAPVKAPAGKGEKLEREFKRKTTLASERIRSADAEKGGGFTRGEEGMRSMGIGRFSKPVETSDAYEYRDAMVLPIGWVDIGSGESRDLNVYKTWQDSTAEVWRTPEGNYRLIFTAGEPQLKIGQRRDFKHYYDWKPVSKTGAWKFIDFLPVKDLMELARVYNKHKFPGYTYK